MLKKLTSVLLIIAMLFTYSTSVFASEKPNNITFNGYTFDVITDNIAEAQVCYTENDTQYIATFDKNSREISMEIIGNNSKKVIPSNSNLLNENSNREKYKITVDDFDNKNIKGIKLIDTNNRVYNLDDPNNNEQVTPQFVWTIPIGIKIGEALIAVLLTLARAIVIGSIAYVIAEEAISLLDRNTYYYFTAVLENNAVYIGPGLWTSQAQTRMALNQRTNGVFAISDNYARGLCASVQCGGVSRGPEGESSAGYWLHYHCKKYPNAHCWFM